MQIGALEIELFANIARLQRDMNRANQVVDSATSGIARAAAAARTALVGMASGLSVGAIVSQLTSAQREFDKLNSSLITATGSMDGASSAYKTLQAFAATTPYSVADATEAFIKMKNLGLDPSERALRSYGNTAAAMGKGLDQMIEAVADAASGEFERLKEFGIKASQENGKVALTFRGVTTSIGNNATEIQKYLKKIGEVEFAGAMERRAKTLDGAISGLGDAWNSFVLKFAQSGFGDAAQDGVRKMSELLDKMSEKVDAVADGMVTAAKIGAAYVGAFVLAPIIFQGAATWLGNLNLQIALARMEMARGTPITTLFAGSIHGVGVSALWASGMLGKLKIATGVLFAAFAGWEIGKYLEEQFVGVKIFAEVLTGAVLEMWEHIKLAFKLGLDAITVLWRATFSGLTASLSTVYSGIASGLSKLGFDEKAGQVQEFADRVRQAGESQGTFASRTAEARAEHERNIKAIRMVTDSHVAAIVVAENVSEATRGTAAAAAAAAAAKKEMSKEEKKALESAQDFIENQKRELEAIGKTEAQQRFLAAARAASLAPTAAQRREIMSLYDAIEAETKAWQDSEAARKAAEDAVGQDAQTLLDLDKRIAGLEQEIRLHGQTADAAIDAELAKAYATASSLAISEEYRGELQKQIAKLERIRELQGKLGDLDKAKSGMTDAANHAQKMADRMGDAITDSLMRGFESGKSFAANMWQTIVNMAKTEALTPFIKGVVGTGMGSLGFGSTASAATGAGSSGAGSLMGAGLSGIMGTIGTGAMQTAGAFLTGQIGLGSTLSAGLGAIGTGTASGIMAGLSSVVGTLGPIALGIAAVATVLKKGFGYGPKEVTRTSIDGTFNAGSFTGNINETWKKEGGWFVSDKGGLDQKAIDAEMVAALNQTYGALKAATADYAKTLGVNAEYVLNRSQNLSVALTGDAAKDQQAIADFFTKIGDDIALELVPSLVQFKQAGESASATVQRLAADYALVDAALTGIGKTFGMVGVESLAAREKLIANSGGAQSFAANTTGFAQNFLTEEQRNAPVLAAVRKELDALGMSAVDTREEFAAAVLALDPLNEAQSVTFGKLIQLQGAFAQVYPAIDKAAEAERERAKAAEHAANVLSEKNGLLDQLAQLSMSPDAYAKSKLDPSNIGLYDDVQAAQKAKDAADALAATKQSLTDSIREIDRSFMSVEQLRAESIKGMDAEAVALYDLLQVRTKEREAADQLKAANESWQAKIDEFNKSQMSAAELQALETKGMDASTLALYNHYQALLANKAAAEAATAAEADLIKNFVDLKNAGKGSGKADTQALDSKRAGMDLELYNLTHTAVEQLAHSRELELAALDPTLRGLQKQIHAAQDLAKAQAEAKAVADEAAGLERQVLQLQGDTVALRKLDLAALNPANRALLEHIHALQDQAEAATAARTALQQRSSLERQLYQVQGNTSKLRELELAALDPSNRALQEKIWAEEARIETERAMAAAMQQAAQQAAQAADQMKSAWQSVTDSIFEEVARIRGLTTGGGSMSFAAAQAGFAMTTAQARAGDQEAAKLLPGLSKTLLDLAEQNVGSMVELRRLQSMTALSLQQTGMGLGGKFDLRVPSFDVGTNYLPSDMLAQVHAGERIIPAADNRALMERLSSPASNNAELVAEIKALRTEVAELRRSNSVENAATAKAAQKTAETLEKWDVIGIPEERIA